MDFECKCGRIFKTKRSINSHARFCSCYVKKEKTRYLKDDKYLCECGRIFEKSQSLNAHFSHCIIHRNGNPPVDRFNGKCGWSKGKTKDTHPGIMSMSQKIRGTTHKHSDETKRKISKSTIGKTGGYRKNSNRGIGSYYNGIWLDSSYEIRYVRMLDTIGIKWEKNKKGFPYDFKGRIYKYIPDFYLPETNEWIEIKGFVREKDQYKWADFPHNLKVLFEIDITNLENGKITFSLEINGDH